ncbi:MAG: cadherin-like domain-containing protein, partial [Cyanobacteria bacterium J06632_3]
DEPDSETNEVAAATQQPPIVPNYSFTITQGESLTVDLLAGASDPNPDDTLELYEIANTPVGGQLLDNGDGTVTYLPWEGATEEDFGAYTNTFQFVITDGNGGFAEGKLSIRVEIPQPILE